MSVRTVQLANLVGGSLFLGGVCLILPMVLFRYVSVAVAGGLAAV